ncbi:MAG: PD-(D/E)XK nuclease family protein [Synergistaceae bacterium]|jgi:RecB family exonuclease|nr:PD-(D/E)XK nuclease family protein [Synergistaceae bacterium]
MLPSLSSADSLMDMLGTERGFFGERPDIWSWSEMYARLVPEAELRRQIDPPDHRLILKYVTDSNIQELEAQEVHIPNGVRRRGFIDILSGAIRELLLEGVTPDNLLEGIDGQGQAENPYGNLLYRLYTDYLLYLESNGLADNSQIPSLLCGLVSSGLPDVLDGTVICWVGFLSFTGSQLKLVKTLRARGQKMEYFTPRTGLDGFHDISAQLGDDVKPLDAGCAAIITLKARDAYAQYDRIASEIAVSSRGHGALWDALSNLASTGVCLEADMAYENIGILVPREGLPILASALEKYGVPHQSRSETCVLETGIIELAKRAWETYTLNWPARRTSFLLQTVGARGLKYADSLDGPDLGQDVRLAPERMSCFPPEGLDAWRNAVANDPGSLLLLERMAAFCAYIDEEGGHTPEELLRALGELCGPDWEGCLAAEAGDDESVDFAVRALASSRLELEQKIEALSELTPPLGEAGRVRFRGSDAIGFLSDWSQEAATALAQPLNGAVSLYDSPPPVLVSHKLWIMTDADPSRYPGSAAEQPMLDSSLRNGVNKLTDSEDSGESDTFVHLPTMREKREQKEALFRRLLSLGETAAVTARAELDSQGRAQDDSPFITSLFADDPAGTSASSNWFIAGEITGASDPRAASPQDRTRRGGFPRTAILKVRDALAKRQKLKVPASAIDEFADCPFSYWCSHIAKFNPPRDETGLFDRAFQGSLVHDIWQKVWYAYLAGLAGLGKECRRTLHSTLLAEWDDANSALDDKYPGLSDRAALAVTAELRNSMAAAALAQDEVEARANEAGFVREKTLFEHRLPPYELPNVSFVGKADRIDIWKGLGAVILDYKLGSSGLYKDSLQLAAYAVMLAKEGIPVMGFGYVGHKDGKVRGCWSQEVLSVYKGASRTRDPEPDDKMSEAADCMDKIDSIAAAGKFAANYDAGGCSSCQWISICRRAERFGFYDEPAENADDNAESVRCD